MELIEKIKSGEITVKDLVKDKKAIFKYFSDGAVIYETEDGFEFPISVEDAKGGKFHAEEKAMTLMRWVRKHFEMVKNGEA
jgi:hypothetical protein